jgi:hypothetical protein
MQGSERRSEMALVTRKQKLEMPKYGQRLLYGNARNP